MTAHDPALVNRVHCVVTQAILDRKSTVEIADGVLDLLAAEGRLCEPGEGDHWRNLSLRKLETDNAALAAEVERLRGFLREIFGVVAERRDGWVWIEMETADMDRIEWEAGLSDEPLIDPDCRDGKHSSCVGDPCECPECEHPR